MGMIRTSTKIWNLKHTNSVASKQLTGETSKKAVVQDSKIQTKSMTGK